MSSRGLDTTSLIASCGCVLATSSRARLPSSWCGIRTTVSGGNALYSRVGYRMTIVRPERIGV